VSNDIVRQPLVDLLYRQYLESEDTAVFVKEVARRYSIPTLERLAERGARLSRRGAVLALGFLADYESNAAVGRALVDRDRTVRTLAENAIRSLWCRCGSENQRQELGVLIRLNNSQQYDEAVLKATHLIDRAPWIAEAWNQRAIAYFSNKRFADAIRDCHQTLEINPYHFGAATGMGYCYLQLKDTASALECFRRALRLNPGLENVRAQLVQLQRSEKKREKDQ
jgi:tetratricopeptide (TPR) repeat protein